jgi:hypothetical protein
LNSSPHIYENDQVNKDEMGRECTTHGEKINACRVFVGKPDGRRLLGRPRNRWEDNIKMNEIGWCGRLD